MDTQLRNNGQDRFADIAPDGDVILIVGADGVRFRVPSESLKSASNIFAIMFGPNWSEGQRLSKEMPTEVALPEDDADAMWTICCILHERNDLLPWRFLATDSVLQFAFLVDKYNLQIDFKHEGIEHQLKPRTSMGMKEAGKLLAAAFLLNDTDAFPAQTAALILDYSKSYLGLFADEVVSQILPAKLSCLLEERRTELRAKLSDILIRGKRRVCNNCGWGKDRNETYQGLLRDYRPMEMLRIPISTVITCLEHVWNEDLRRYEQNCPGTSISDFFLVIREFEHRPPEKDQTPLDDLSMMRYYAGMSITFVRTRSSADA